MSHAVIDQLFAQFEASIQGEAAMPLFRPGELVYIYGAGNAGKELFRLLARQQQPVAGFLDRNAKPGAAWESAPILLPDDPALSPHDRKKSHVVLGVFSPGADSASIKQLLTSLGYGRVTSFLELHAKYLSEMGDLYWLTAREFYRGKIAQVTAAYELLSDDASRKVFVDVLRARFFRDDAALPAPNFQDQYFPTGLPAWPGPLRLADCGAFDGDTLRYLVDHKIPVEAVAAFEPDPVNFPKLAQSAAKTFAGAETTICLFPCGVAAELGAVKFSSGSGPGSHISEGGENMIQCVPLDQALALFRPNLIKMDIEGAEYDALLGARRIIAEHRPGLAICVYHRPEHLWSLPLRMAEYLPRAKHYLRSHAYNGFDLVHYAMP